MQGIDISHHNAPIDWPNLDPATDFVIIKATDGHSVDKLYANSMAACRALTGPTVGSYHWFQPAIPPTAQFNTIVNTIDQRSGDLPIALDIEDQYDSTGKVLTHAMGPGDVPNVAALVSMIYAKYGFYPMIYTGKYVWNAMGNPNVVGSVTFADCPLWIAQYTGAAAPSIPLPWLAWRIWQYSSNGKVAGLPGNTDMDRTLDDLADIRVP